MQHILVAEEYKMHFGSMFTKEDIYARNNVQWT